MPKTIFFSSPVFRAVNAKKCEERTDIHANSMILELTPKAWFVKTLNIQQLYSPCFAGLDDRKNQLDNHERELSPQVRNLVIVSMSVGSRRGCFVIVSVSQWTVSWSEIMILGMWFFCSSPSILGQILPPPPPILAPPPLIFQKA